MNIRTKIICGCSLLAVVIFGAASLGVSTAKEIRHDVSQLVSCTAVSLELSDKIRDELDELNELFDVNNALRVKPETALTVAKPIFATINNDFTTWLAHVRKDFEEVQVEGNEWEIRMAKNDEAFIIDMLSSLPEIERITYEAIQKGAPPPHELHMVKTRVHAAFDRDQQRASDQLSQIERRSVAFTKAIWWGALGVCVFATGLATVQAFNLVRPISALMRGTRNVGLDDFRPLPIESKDEFGRLAQSFNDMAARLDATTVSKSYVDRILASMVNTLLIVDADNNITFANDSALKLLGYTLNEITGRKLEDVVVSTGDHLCIANEIREKASVTEIEINYLTKTKKVMPMTFSGSLLKEDNSLICVAHDITARKVAELEVERVNRELREASVLSGMAEVATGVLHNVGNVLNSLNVSATVVDERVKKAPNSRLRDVVQLLESNAGSLPEFFASARGQQLPAYLAKLHTSQEVANAEIAHEVASLRKNIEHIREIVTMQQDYARISGVAENISLVDIIEDAIRLNSGALVRHHVELLRDFTVNPVLSIEKHKVLQILVNLIRNAKYACDEGGAAEKFVTLRTETENGTVKIIVKDNGIGIPPENMTRNFNHGFTTRKEGHGFGLHSGALAANELKGTLSAQSDGPGHGASFILTLPCPLAA